MTEENEHALTGSGAPAGDDSGLPPEGDGGAAAAEATEEQLLQKEPTSLGMVRQDNVSEPGVEKTHSIDGSTSEHGREVEARQAAEDAAEEAAAAEAEPDPDA